MSNEKKMKKMLCIYTQTIKLYSNTVFYLFINFIFLSTLTNSTVASSSEAIITIGALNGSCVTCLYLLLAGNEKKTVLIIKCCSCSWPKPFPRSSFMNRHQKRSSSCFRLSYLQTIRPQYNHIKAFLEYDCCPWVKRHSINCCEEI